MQGKEWWYQSISVLSGIGTGGYDYRRLYESCMADTDVSTCHVDRDFLENHGEFLTDISACGSIDPYSDTHGAHPIHLPNTPLFLLSQVLLILSPGL